MGSGFFEQLSKDLKEEFPDMQGFSSTNLKYCKRFYMFYNHDYLILQQVAAKLDNENLHQLGAELQSQLNGQLQAVNDNDVIIRQQLADELKPQLNGQLQAVNDDVIIRPQVVDELKNHPIFQIPWFHHVQIITKCKSVKEALFYVQKTIENGWSRAVLMNFMEADLFSAQGKALTPNYKNLNHKVHKEFTQRTQLIKYQYILLVSVVLSLCPLWLKEQQK